jgi:alginate O-acetyltransferase complex protein AlgI
MYFALHLAIPAKFRLSLIIVGSTLFYAYWNPLYVWVPYLLTFLSYVGALWIDITNKRTKQLRMLVVVSVLLLPLLLVKYSHFLYNDFLSPLFGLNEKDLKLSLPLGLSFITFTAIAYVADVYRQRFPVERRISMLTGLFLFFPHLIAGPILRPHELLPRLDNPRSSRKALGIRTIFALTIFSVGLLKKLVFADSIATWVDTVYASSEGITALGYMLAIYGFSLQIYCDFSGYTDMAIGLAILLGVKLPLNFRHPYSAISIIDFWRRWHITLSNWLRDYLYISLGGNRAGYVRQALNVFITMTVGGLWHGASWTFVIWGAMQGMGIALVHGFRKVMGPHSIIFKLPKFFWVFITFHFVTFCWILFRAPNLDVAYRVMLGPFMAPKGNLSDFINEHLFQIILLGLFFITHRFDSHQTIRRFVSRSPKTVLWLAIGLCWLLAMTMNISSSEKFIYYDF